MEIPTSGRRECVLVPIPIPVDWSSGGKLRSIWCNAILLFSDVTALLLPVGLLLRPSALALPSVLAVATATVRLSHAAALCHGGADGRTGVTVAAAREGSHTRRGRRLKPRGKFWIADFSTKKQRELSNGVGKLFSQSSKFLRFNL